MVDDVLVDRRAGGDQDRHAGARSPSGPAELLPGPGDRARVAGEDRDVQPPDVHAELEGVGGDDAEDLTVAQAVLDRAALGREVAAAVAADLRPERVALADRLAEPGQQQLHRDPGPSEDDRLAPRPEEGEGPPLAQGDGRAARTAGGIQQRGVHQQHVALAGRRPVPGQDFDRPSDQGFGQLTGVPDRGRAADDHRVAAVVGTDPHEASEHVGDMSTEHAAIGVQFVDDDVAELLEQLEPLRVMRQDRRVEHVRVGGHHLPGAADGGADGCRRVAVIGGGRHVEPGRTGELAELGDLVLAERLGREEEEGARRGIVGDRLEDRQRVAEGLARGGRGDHHEVATGAGHLQRLRLVDVGSLDPALREAGHDPWVKPIGEAVELGRAGFEHGVVHDPPRHRRLREQDVQDRCGVVGGVGSHREGPQREQMYEMLWSLADDPRVS